MGKDSAARIELAIGKQLLVASANWWTEVWRAFFSAH